MNFINYINHGKNVHGKLNSKSLMRLGKIVHGKIIHEKYVRIITSIKGNNFKFYERFYYLCY